MDPSQPDVSLDRFTKYDWVDFYRGAKELIPNGMPEPRGKFMSIYAFVDSDHAGDKIGRLRKF